MYRILFYLIFLLVTSTGYALPRGRGMTVAPGISPESIGVLGEWSVDIVRYQFVWNEADDKTADEYRAWLDSTMQLLDSLLPHFAANNVKVVLDLHTPPGGFVYREPSPALHRIFHEQWTQDQLIETWQKLATHYKGNSTIFGYDIVNEPAQASLASGLLDWSKLAAKTAAAIYAIDQTHNIIVEPIFGNQSKFGRLKPIKGIPTIMYSFHMYFPLNFQQQGLYNFKLGVKYPNEKKKLNKKGLGRAMEQAMNYQKKTKKPMYVGEFSAVRWAPGESAYNYLRDVISLFEKNKWSWTYHAFREDNAWSVEHGGVYKSDVPSPTETSRAKLLKKYFRKS